jgi:sugar phosphate isomerase/epimerase
MSFRAASRHHGVPSCSTRPESSDFRKVKDMKRRDFLRAGALGGLACGFALSPAADAGEGPAPPEAEPRSRVADRLPGSKLKLSCAAYSFREQLSGPSPSMSLEDFVDFCAREGLEAAELTSYYFTRTDSEYLCSLRRRASVNGLSISGTPVGNNFCLPPGEERQQQLRRVKEWIERAAILGAETIRVFAGSVPRGGTEEEARGWAIDCLKEVSEQAGKRGILLALENHGGITSSAAQLLALIEGVSSPWLGVNLDTGNFHRKVYESLEAAAPHAVAVQVKVEIREEGGRTEPADLERIARILHRAGYRGYVALEYEAREEARTAVPRHLAALRRALEAAARG